MSNLRPFNDTGACTDVNAVHVATYNGAGPHGTVVTDVDVAYDAGIRIDVDARPQPWRYAVERA